MKRPQVHSANLDRLLAGVLPRGDVAALARYLAAHSNLPGPRGNLELAQAFARLVAVPTGRARTTHWDVCVGLAGLSPREAPTNTPGEFVAFCGARGLGAIGAASPAHTRRALVYLRRLADDPRWRVREAVAMGLTDLLGSRPQQTLAALKTWIKDSAWLAMRAVAAGLAEPALLDGHPATIRAAVDLHRRIIGRMRQARQRPGPEFRTLRQGLGYTLSVVVAAAPADGFALLRTLAAPGDPDLTWIVRENLTKRRLGAWPAEVAGVAKILARGATGRGRRASPPPA